MSSGPFYVCHCTTGPGRFGCGGCGAPGWDTASGTLRAAENGTTTTPTLLVGICHYCGNYHTGLCPRIKEIEYDEVGRATRVKFHKTPDPYPLVDGSEAGCP